MRFLACVFFLACWHADAKRALKADLSTDADANDMGIPTGSGAHVGSCSPVNLDGGATGEQCSGKLWLRRDPGNTGYYKFKNANGKGMIGWNVYSETRNEGKPVRFILSTLNDTELNVALKYYEAGDAAEPLSSLSTGYSGFPYSMNPPKLADDKPGATSMRLPDDGGTASTQLFPMPPCVDQSTNPTCYFVLVVEKVGTTSYANWIDYSITSYPDGTAPLTTSTATMTTVTTKTTKTTVTTVANVTAAPSRVATTLPSKLPMETCSTKPVLCVGASFCAAVNVVSAESCSAHCATTYKSYDLDFYYEASINSNIQTCLCRKHIPAGCDVVAVCCDVDDSASATESILWVGIGVGIFVLVVFIGGIFGWRYYRNSRGLDSKGRAIYDHPARQKHALGGESSSDGPSTGLEEVSDGKIEFVKSRSKKDLVNRPTSKFINPAFSPEDAPAAGNPDGAFAQPSGHYFPGSGPGNSGASNTEDDDLDL